MKDSFHEEESLFDLKKLHREATLKIADEEGDQSEEVFTPQSRLKPTHVHRKSIIDKQARQISASEQSKENKMQARLEQMA